MTINEPIDTHQTKKKRGRFYKDPTFIALFLIFLVIATIGGYMHISNHNKRMNFLHETQTDLANYVYQNYQFYELDEKAHAKVVERYKSDKNMNQEDYLKEAEKTRTYLDIKKIEFTGFKMNPMNTLEVYFTINDVYKDYADVHYYDKKIPKYHYVVGPIIKEHPENNYKIFKRDKAITNNLNKDHIVYYNGDV